MGLDACCDHLAVHTRDQNHSHSECMQDFTTMTKANGDKVASHEAVVFTSSDKKLKLYRGKDGDWIVGKEIGKSRKGALLRSQDPDRESFIQECPCQTKVWQKNDGKNWTTDNDLRIVIRKSKTIIEM